MSQTTMLEVRGLEVAMGSQKILRGVSIAVGAQSIVAVLGSNGVGKTTLMRAISGIYRPSGGEILLEGRRLDGRPSHEIVQQGVSQAPEGRHLFPNMTVADNLDLGAGKLSGNRKAETLERVYALFPVVRERLAQKAGSLSGGEQQMVCIARAMMSRPRLLMLDEPSLGLAPRLVHQIFELIAQIRAGGTSVLLVEQNARASLEIADYAYVMEGGAVMLEGRPATLAADDRVRRVYLGG
jgi:branched-chain amino acid transport system ATP-binding protein